MYSSSKESRQSKKLWHVSNLYRVPEQEELARKLVGASFADSAFFCNSGAEAVEASIKIVRTQNRKIAKRDTYRT